MCYACLITGDRERIIEQRSHAPHQFGVPVLIQRNANTSSCSCRYHLPVVPMAALRDTANREDHKKHSWLREEDLCVLCLSLLAGRSSLQHIGELYTISRAADCEPLIDRRLPDRVSSRLIMRRRITAKEGPLVQHICSRLRCSIKCDIAWR
ncbi:uncharacterized protein LAESUDRAFT_282427 [Laetiporus sulphureus 93-53]|uniref:Uncharacterized protein n=1 Tax=Laetiporus sulphureus 93-53 TaxID=1314785 RepID=A0A165DF20_9APHY|nr:uncharacterized protein LAESUDRAFT_282427 [Laetiporus sulphureus 93-53]KZT04748.1 hypothetical protein LAESUDRAFT_282427 [Laetiporus sulphureus 93-53]